VQAIHLETELSTSADRVWRAMCHPAWFGYVTRGLIGVPALAGRTDPFCEGETGTGWLLLVRNHLMPGGPRYASTARQDPGDATAGPARSVRGCQPIPGWAGDTPTLSAHRQTIHHQRTRSAARRRRSKKADPGRVAPPPVPGTGVIAAVLLRPGCHRARACFSVGVKAHVCRRIWWPRPVAGW
jgi:hypothetical protein